MPRRPFPDGTEVELVQLVKGVSWKGIRFNTDRPPKAYGYPVERGTYIPIERDEALLWTQGSVRGVNLSNSSYNISQTYSVPHSRTPFHGRGWLARYVCRHRGTYENGLE
jgi:hypothetical protein